ncbi:MAG: hypothetical protein HYS39_00215 [Proteobacteria bacterium]|nr:hypothetical protein [Pseudomonadota bacterium]
MRKSIIQALFHKIDELQQALFEENLTYQQANTDRSIKIQEKQAIKNLLSQQYYDLCRRFQECNCFEALDLTEKQALEEKLIILERHLMENKLYLDASYQANERFKSILLKAVQHRPAAYYNSYGQSKTVLTSPLAFRRSL